MRIFNWRKVLLACIFAILALSVICMGILTILFFVYKK